MSIPHNHGEPPKWAIRLLNWFCPERLIEAILGDLLEQFEDDLTIKSARRARWRFIWNVIRLFHPAILTKNKKMRKFNSMGLFKSHFTVALRSMKKYKFYAVVNILGLSLAISFVFLAYLFIQNELSYDDFHSKKNRTYRLYGYLVDEETGEIMDGNYSGWTPIPLAPDLAAAVPGIIHYTRYGSTGGTVLKNETPYEEIINMVDNDFFEMFDFPIIHGHKNMLNNRTGLVLSEERAEKYFGEQNPIGQPFELTLNDSTVTFTVTGVVNNRKSQSSFKFDIAVPFELMRLCVEEEAFTSYNMSFSESWVTFDQPQDSDIENTFAKVFGDKMDMHTGKGRVGLQPLTKVHFDTQIPSMLSISNPTKIWILAGLSVLVLVIALVNFITLSTGHSLHRIKEIGLRKTFGANKANLRIQLIFESLLISFIASLLAIVFTFYFLPEYNLLIEGSVDQSVLLANLGFMIVLILVVSGISGGAQALVLVDFAPTKVLRGHGGISARDSWSKQSVIIFKFAMSILLVAGTMVIHQQMVFVQQKDLGFDEERLIEINLHTSSDRQAAQQLVDRFKNELKSNPMILSASASMNNLQDQWTLMSFKQEDESLAEFYFNQVDQDYLKAMELETVVGHSFGQKGPPLPTDIMVNETLVKTMGWTDPLNEQIPGVDFKDSHRIIGVFKDFHYGSLHQKIKPLILATDAVAIEAGIYGISTQVWPPNFYSMVVRVGPGDLFEVADYLESTWSRVNGDKAFTFQFVDDILSDQYAEEARWRKVINIAAAFALVIAWMGLLGLTRLSLQRRVKEIGIRKVLGSSTLSIVQKLSSRYLTLVCIAGLIATPFGWWASQSWLESFTYRINLNVLTFGLAALIVLIITGLSLGIQSYRTALANPVDSLRSE